MDGHFPSMRKRLEKLLNNLGMLGAAGIALQFALFLVGVYSARLFTGHWPRTPHWFDAAFGAFGYSCAALLFGSAGILMLLHLFDTLKARWSPPGS